MEFNVNLLRRYTASPFSGQGSNADLNLSSLELAGTAKEAVILTSCLATAACVGNSTPLASRLHWATGIGGGAESIYGVSIHSPNSPIGGGRSAALVRGRHSSENSVATLITATRGAKGRGAMMAGGTTAVGASPTSGFDLVGSPWVLWPGDGIVVAHSAQAATLYAISWEWVEVPRHFAENALNDVLSAIKNGLV